MSISYVVSYGNGLSQTFTSWTNAQATINYLLIAGGYSSVSVKKQIYNG